jgi:leucyl-tRNA synthetase
LERAWGPVDCYVGGAEHAVLHLLYARFWHKVLYDLGFVSTKEPFQKLRHQGMILSYSNRDAKGNYHPYEDVAYDEQGRARLAATGEALVSQVEKMSKSKKNVVNPDAVLKRYGADAFRLYEMFMGPFEQAKPWDMRSIEGVHRFLRRAYVLVNDLETAPAEGEGLVALRHRTIKKVGEDIEAFGFNTCISSLMIYLNALQDEKPPAKADVEAFLALLNPFAPHLSEELWEKLGHGDLLCRRPWPSWDAEHLADSTIEYPVQVNGKLRATFTIAADAAEAAVKDAALANEKVKAAVDGKQIVKIILIPKKLVNLVVK